MKTEILKAAMNSLDIESKALENISTYIDQEAIYRAIEAITKAERIVTSGSGGSGTVAKKFAHSLKCVEMNGFFIPPSEALHGGMGALKKGDVLVLVSRGGKTDELLPMLDVALKKGVTVISLIENLDSPMGKHSHIVIQFKVGPESDPLNIMTTTSSIIPVAIFDAIQAGIIIATGFTREQFALIHPGGAVGKFLND